MKNLSLVAMLACLTASLNAQDGTLDLSFNPGNSINAYPTEMIVQTDGKIILTGDFTTYNGVSRRGVVRINNDGSVDNSFTPGTGMNGNYVFDVAIQPDGKYILVGDFSMFNGVAANGVVRLNTDGTVDGSFDIGTGADVNPQFVCVQSNGKILVAGDFTSFDGQPSNNLVRLNSDGSVDAAFSTGTGADGSSIINVLLQPDDKILLMGNFSTFNNIPTNYVLRLNSDGSVDADFNMITAFDAGGPYAADVMPDGRIVVCGNLRITVDSQSIRGVVRLMPDGFIDSTFVGTATFSSGSIIRDVVVQPDNKIIIGGTFPSYAGINSQNFARISEDGSTVDTSFQVGTGFDGGAPYFLNLQSDGKILAAGIFYAYNGTSIDRIGRIHGSSVNSIKDITTIGSYALFPNPCNDILTLTFEKNLPEKIELMDISGKTHSVEKQQVNAYSLSLNTSKILPGIYVLKLYFADGVSSQRVIKN